MIPGTLRPLPKKLKEVKEAVDRLLRDIRYSDSITADIFANSENYDYQQIRSHYNKLIEHYNDLVPLWHESDRLLDKYVNDYLLNEMVFKMYSEVDRTIKKLDRDINQLETMLMARRKKYIERQIPYLHSQIKEKLAHIKDLSFEEIIAKVEDYSKIIGEIVGGVEELRDEYLKLISGSFDVSDMYAYLEDDIKKLEEIVGEYDLILRTCRMELLKTQSDKIIEPGKELFERFSSEQSEELLEDANKYLEEAGNLLDEMNHIRIEVPKKGYSTEFVSKYQQLAEEFVNKRNELQEIVQKIQDKTDYLNTQIDRIKGIKEIFETGPLRFNRGAKILRSKRKFTLKYQIKQEIYPYLSMDEMDNLKIVALEIDSKVTNDILELLNQTDQTPIMKELGNFFKTLNFRVIWADTKKISIKIAKIAKSIAIKVGKYITGKVKTLINKVKGIKKQEPELEEEVEETED